MGKSLLRYAIFNFRANRKNMRKIHRTRAQARARSRFYRYFMTTIFHVDMDAFFASVEIVKNPSLKGKPVIVGGNPNSRGVVSTCSYEARAFGVRSAMSLFEAKQRCPKGIFVDGDYALYKAYSQQIMAIFESFTHEVECVSIDEAYIDMTSCLKHDSPFNLGREIRRRVLEETQLTCSVGIGSNKLIAKIASSLAKPNGLYEIPPGKEKEFLGGLDIQRIPGIGTKTQLILNKDGFKTIAQLQEAGIDGLVRLYGSRGYHYYQAACGRDNRPVEWQDQLPKSIGAETTFEKDQDESTILIDTLTELTEKVCRRLRKLKMRTKRIAIKLRYSDFKTITRTGTLESHQNALEIILEEVVLLFKENYSGSPALRLVGVSLEQLTDGYWQPTFWDARD